MGIMWHQATAPSGDDHWFRSDRRQSGHYPRFGVTDGWAVIQTLDSRLGDLA
jgi:hypothetical protein